MRWFFLSVFFFYTYTSFSQLLPFKVYTEKDGLNTKSVYCVIRDDRGLLWVGTQFGINWFDGSHFFQPSVPKRVDQLYVQRFFKDKQGNIWVLTFYNGFYKFQNDHFRQYLIDSAYKDINKNNIMDMTQLDSSHYVIAADRGIYEFDGERFNRIDQKNLNAQVSTVLFANNFLLVGAGDGIYCYQYNKGWKLVSKSLKGITINKFYFHGNNLWVATDKGLYYFNQFDFNKSDQTGTIYEKGQLVSDVVINVRGEIWFPCKGMVYKISENKLIEYPYSTGLNAVSSQIYFDQQNIGWFSTREGLYKLTQEYFRFTKKVPFVTSIIKWDGNIWVSYPNGISDMSGKEHFILPNNPIISFYRLPSKKIIISGKDGLYEIMGHQLKKRFSLHCAYLYTDNDDYTWIATYEGKLYRCKNEKVEPVNFNCFEGDFISVIIKDKNGFIWLGFRTGGILKCRAEKDSLITVKEFSSLTGFSDMKVRSCHTDSKGNILFGTRTNGLFIFSSINDKFWHLNYNNGLNATWIRSIDSDDRSVYLGTNNGIYILKSEIDYLHPSFHSVYFNNEISNEINYVLADKESIWAGSNGLIQLFPDKIESDTSSPPVFITQVSVEGKKDSSWIPYGGQLSYLKLPFNKNIIAFEFSGVHLKNDESLQYRYKLEGQDNEWNILTGGNFVSYNLPPGKYRFLVQALSASGKWGRQTASYSFMISPPFWTAWWFIALNILLIAGIVYIIYYYRLQQAMKLERLRYKISTDLHDDIGSTLSSISILSEMALTEINHEQNAAMVTEIKENSLSLLEKMDDIVWSINPKNDSLGSLLLRIKRFSSRLFEAKDIEYTVDIDKAVDEIKLPMEYRQHIYLILKEAINNLVKYSNATNASIEVNYLSSILKIRVSDNGKGIDNSSMQAGNGLISMKSRAALMKANLKIESNINEGTTIRIEVKIK